MFGRGKRIDQALDRDRAAFEGMMDAFERNSEAFERNREAFERNGEAFERNREAFEDLKVWTRDLTRRNEVVWREVMEELRAGQRAIADMREQIQANTKAVLSVLDRFDNGGGAGAA